MPYTASHRFAHGGAQKARLVADLIRGKSLDEAEAILRLSPKRAASLRFSAAVSGGLHTVPGATNTWRVIGLVRDAPFTV